MPARTLRTGVPAEFRVGRCVEVWGDASGLYGPEVAAHGRFSRALAQWAESEGLSQDEAFKLVGSVGAPWSVRLLASRGETELAAQRLAAAGATEADLPALRRAAKTWLECSAVAS